MKVCSKCRESKPVSEFGKDRSRKDGLSSRCRPCANADNRARIAARRAKNAERTLEERRVARPFKRCSVCKETKPSSMFSSNIVMPDGLSSNCSTCNGALVTEWLIENSERVAAYRRENAERISEYQAAYHARRYAEDESYRLAMYERGHARRALQLSQPSAKGEASIRAHVYDRDGGVCAWCSTPVTMNEMHLDHVIALRANVVDVLVEIGEYPGSVPWNYVVSCGPCNIAKSNKLTEEAVTLFRELRKLYASQLDEWEVREPTFEQRERGYAELMASSDMEDKGPGSLLYAAIVGSV